MLQIYMGTYREMCNYVSMNGMAGCIENYIRFPQEYENFCCRFNSS